MATPRAVSARSPCSTRSRGLSSTSCPVSLTPSRSSMRSSRLRRSSPPSSPRSSRRPPRLRSWTPTTTRRSAATSPTRSPTRWTHASTTCAPSRAKVKRYINRQMANGMSDVEFLLTFTTDIYRERQPGPSRQRRCSRATRSRARRSWSRSSPSSGPRPVGCPSRCRSSRSAARPA